MREPSARVRPDDGTVPPDSPRRGRARASQQGARRGHWFGVLALAALTLGVPRAVGLDIDPGAMNAAAANARLNDLYWLHLVHGGPAAVIGAWPLVMANLLTGPLLELAPELVRRVCIRQLLLSGIRSSTRSEVENAYVGWGMQRIASSARDRWVALLLQASW